MCGLFAVICDVLINIDKSELERVDLWSPFVQLYIGSQTITKANDTILL